jgi:membrane-associated phospholipid phosphatase
VEAFRGPVARTLLVVATTAALLQPIQSFDERVQGAVQASRAPATEGVMRAATRVGNPGLVFGGLLAIAVLGGPVGVATARAALAVLLPVNAVVELMKLGFGRTRPDHVPDRRNSSFPSSHAANAFALATVLARRWRRGAPVFVGVAGIVAFSRVYLNRHYVSDVVVGAAIGVACAILVEAWQARRRVPVTAKAPAAEETVKI